MRGWTYVKKWIQTASKLRSNFVLVLLGPRSLFRSDVDTPRCKNRQSPSRPTRFFEHRLFRVMMLLRRFLETKIVSFWTPKVNISVQCCIQKKNNQFQKLSRSHVFLGRNEQISRDPRAQRIIL